MFPRNGSREINDISNRIDIRTICTAKRPGEREIRLYDTSNWKSEPKRFPAKVKSNVATRKAPETLVGPQWQSVMFEPLHKDKFVVCTFGSGIDRYSVTKQDGPIESIAPWVTYSHHTMVQ